MSYTGINLLFANNAGSNLAGPITNTATTLSLTSGGGALFPSPSLGQGFVITAIDAATGLLREIMLCTSRSVDTLTVVRAQEGTVALNWLAGDLIQQLWTAGQAATFGTGYVKVVPQTTFYVNNVTGSDTVGNGLSAGTAWATLAYAISRLTLYNFGGQTVTLQLANTGINYAGNVSITAPNTGTLIIQGNAGAQSSYVIAANAPSTSAVVLVIGNGTVTLIGLTILNTNAQGSGIISENGAVCNLQNVTVSTSVAGSTALILVSVGGQLNLGPGNIMAGSADNMIISQDGGAVVQSANVSHQNSPTYAVAVMNIHALATYTCSTTGLSWVSIGGSAVTGQRYGVYSYAVIQTGTGDPNFFPGTIAGVASNGLYS